MNRSILLLALSLFGLSSLAAEEKFWTNNKITPDQPFPASVRAVSQRWDGYELLLEEIGGKQRLCFAKIYMSNPLKYTVVTEAEANKETTKDPNRPAVEWIKVSPPIDVDRFSWSIGPWRLGRIFGDDDILRKVAPLKDQAE